MMPKKAEKLKTANISLKDAEISINGLKSRNITKGKKYSKDF